MLEAAYRRRRESLSPERYQGLVSARSPLPPFASRRRQEIPLGASPPAMSPHPLPAYQTYQRDAAEYTEDYGTTESLRPRRSSYGDRSEGDGIIIDRRISYEHVVPRSNTSPVLRARALPSSDRDRNPGGMGVRKEVVPGSGPVAAPRTFRGVSMEREGEHERLRVYERARARALERENRDRVMERDIREREQEARALYQENRARALERELRDLEPSELEQDRRRDLEREHRYRAMEREISEREQAARALEREIEHEQARAFPLPQVSVGQPLVDQEVITHHRHIDPGPGRALYSQQRRRSPESSKSMQTTNNGYESDYEKPESAGTGMTQSYTRIWRRPLAKATADDLSSGEDGGGRRPGPRQNQFRKMNHKFGKMMFADSVSGDSSTAVFSSANETISKDNTKECARQLKLLAELGPKHRSYWVNGQSPQEQETSTTRSEHSMRFQRAETFRHTTATNNIRYATPPTQYRQYSDDDSPRRSSARPEAETLSRPPLAVDAYIVSPPSPPPTRRPRLRREVTSDSESDSLTTATIRYSRSPPPRRTQQRYVYQAAVPRTHQDVSDSFF